MAATQHIDAVAMVRLRQLNRANNLLGVAVDKVDHRLKYIHRTSRISFACPSPSLPPTGIHSHHLPRTETGFFTQRNAMHPWWFGSPRIAADGARPIKPHERLHCH